jgi:hypothetical protein
VFTINSTVEFLSSGSQLVWIALPPNMTTLGVRYEPACNENTLRGMLPHLDALRERGFRRIACYPNLEFNLEIPLVAGADPVINVPQGWYCAEAGGQPSSCARDLARCHGMGGAGCKRVERAWCMNDPTDDGFDLCFGTEDMCQAMATVSGSPPCEPKS